MWSLTPVSGRTVKPYMNAQWLVSLSRPGAIYVVNPHSSHVGFEDANAHRVRVRVYVRTWPSLSACLLGVSNGDTTN